MAPRRLRARRCAHCERGITTMGGDTSRCTDARATRRLRARSTSSPPARTPGPTRGPGVYSSRTPSEYQRRYPARAQIPIENLARAARRLPLVAIPLRPPETMRTRSERGSSASPRAAPERGPFFPLLRLPLRHAVADAGPGEDVGGVGGDAARHARRPAEATARCAPGECAGRRRRSPRTLSPAARPARRGRPDRPSAVASRSTRSTSTVLVSICTTQTGARRGSATCGPCRAPRVRCHLGRPPRRPDRERPRHSP